MPQPSPTYVDLYIAATNSRSACIVELNRAIEAIAIVMATDCYCAGASRCNLIGNRMVDQVRRMEKLVNNNEGVKQ